MFASFKQPGFKPFYVHSTFAAVDMNVRMAVHGWMVLELSNDSEFWVGIYALVLGAGQILFSSFAGTLADRFQRRNVLLLEGISGTTLAALIAVTVYLDVMQLWMAIALAFPVGCLRATRFTATNRLVYDLVGPERLVNGVSLWRIANNAGDDWRRHSCWGNDRLGRHLGGVHAHRRQPALLAALPVVRTCQGVDRGRRRAAHPANAGRPSVCLVQRVPAHSFSP